MTRSSSDTPTHSFVAGIDGGQTSTKCVLATLDGQIVARSTGLGIVHFAADGALDLFERSLRECLTSAFEQINLPTQPLAALVLGLTGIERNTPEAHLAEQISKGVVKSAHIHACSDADAALAGAHGGKPGIIVISGTGSHIRGINASGEVASAGGWGWLLGDEGSAMWLGREGVMAALRQDDGLDASNALANAIRQHFGLVKLRDDVKRIIYQSDFGAKGFAALAAVVSQCAAAGDGVSAGIIAQGAMALARQTQTVHARLALGQDSAIAPTGGAFEHVYKLRDGFVAALQTLQVPSAVVEPQHPTATGAALMALKLGGGAHAIL